MPRRCWGLLALVGVVIFSAPGFADILPVGPIIPSASWAQRWAWAVGVGAYDQFQFNLLTPGASFETPSIRNFDRGGWTHADPSGTFALATGPATANLQFQVTFNGTSSSSLTMDFVGFRVGEDVYSDSAHITWDGQSWGIFSTGVGNYHRVAVPEYWGVSESLRFFALVLAAFGAMIGLRVLRPVVLQPLFRFGNGSGGIENGWSENKTNLPTGKFLVQVLSDAPPCDPRIYRVSCH